MPSIFFSYYGVVRLQDRSLIKDKKTGLWAAAFSFSIRLLSTTAGSTDVHDGNSPFINNSLSFFAIDKRKSKLQIQI